MRQLLCNSEGALVARMPRPIAGAGQVLVKVHASLVSAGTEIAPLRAAVSPAREGTPLEQATAAASLARRTLGKAVRDPRKALQRATAIVRREIDRRTRARGALPPAAPADLGEDATGLSGEGRARDPGGDMADQGWSVGYSAAGVVVEAGEGVTDLVPGDRVACAGAGVANHAEYIAVPRNLVARVPRGCTLEQAAATTVGAIALQGVRRARLELNDTVCVLGLGLIGQLTVQLVRASGARVVGIDLDEERVARARDLGMEEGASDEKELMARIRDLTGGHGADATIITAATSSSAVVNLSMEVTRRRGRVVLVGDVGLEIERARFYKKEIDLLMSTSYGPGRYDRAYEVEGRDYPYAHVRWTLNRNLEAFLDLVERARVRIEPLIDRVVGIDDAPAAYRELASGGGGLPLGVMIRYADPGGVASVAADAASPGAAATEEAPADAAASSLMRLRGHRRAPDGPIRYALVGAGAFGTSMLVPQMEKRRDRFFLGGVVSRSAAGANFARARRVEVLATDLDEILRDPDFGLVVIATRHHEHAHQAARALEAGKHVFVEKPLALTWEELGRVEEAYLANRERASLMVGFNRRFSPALGRLAEILAGRRSPLVISYRLNGGHIPRESWIQGREGGGRNLGEACHIYDVFRFLAGAPAVSLSAHAIDPGSLPLLRNDNFSATLRYGDGSVASLIYTALGPREGLGKERVEVFCDSEAYLIDDYKRLLRASDGTTLWRARDDEPDKGHREELSRFGDALAAAAPAPIPFDEIMETSAVALRVEELLHDRRGDGDDDVA